MKQKLIGIILFFIVLTACKKDQKNTPSIIQDNGNLSLDQVKQWHKPDTAFSVNWNDASFIHNKKGSYWMVGITGRPLFQKQKLGYRRLSFYRDSIGNIQEHTLEIIPDQLYLQRKQKVSSADFTGRIFIYNTSRHLLAGEIYQNGKQTGVIKLQAATTGSLHTASAPVVIDEDWYQYGYTDSEGNAVIVAEKVYTISGGEAEGSPGNTSDPGAAAANPTGGGTGNPTVAPSPSNLPGEDHAAVNPKELIKCFGNIPDQGATMKVTIYVQEPFPGTTFNYGPNSVGHVAIALTKSNGTSSITQIVGFYPNASGASKMHAPSKIVDNSSLDYNVNINYTVTADNFNAIANYISNPPATYDISDFNCTNFVYNASKAGGITLPDPYNTIGLSGPGGAGYAMTPAGLGNSIENLKDNPNVNTNGGTAPLGKGACN